MSPQQKIHWDKLQLLGMCAQMRGTLNFIKNKMNISSTINLEYSLRELAQEIEEVQNCKMKIQKKLDAQKKMKEQECT